MDNEQITKIFFKAKQGNITLNDLNIIENYIKELEDVLKDRIRVTKQTNRLHIVK